MRTVETLRWIFEQVQLVNSEPQPQPGLSRAEVVSALDALGLRLPEPVIQLYVWHNGIFHLDAFLHFLPLEEAISNYRSYKDSTERFGGFGWKPSWLSIMDINGDITLNVDVVSGELASVDLEDNSVIMVAPHYEPYVQALREIFERKAYSYDEVSGLIEADPASWAELAQVHGFRRSWWAADAQ